MPRNARLMAVLLLAAAVGCERAPEPAAPETAVETVGTMGLSGPADPALEGQTPDMSAVARFPATARPGGPARAFAIIGAEGGSVRLGDFEMIVPAGAITKGKSRFEIRITEDRNNREYAFASFSPHNVEFAVPVTIRLPHANTDAAAVPDAVVMWWDGAAWVPMPTQHTLDGRVETQTTHFSLWATSRRGITVAGG